MDITITEPRVRARNVGIAVWMINIGIWIGYLLTSDDPRDRSADDWIFLAILGLVLAVIWRLVVVGPVGRADGNTPAKVGLITSIIGVLSNAMFWTGLPLVLGVGAATLGYEGRRRASMGAGRGGMAQAALILGAAATVVWAVFLFVWD